MAKRKELEVGQEWAFVYGRNYLHDETCGWKCTIVEPRVRFGSQNDVKVSYETMQFGELREQTKTIQLWQLKELWETFEPKMKQAVADERVAWAARQKYEAERRLHEDIVAEPKRQELSKLLEEVTGEYVSQFDLKRTFSEAQIDKLILILSAREAGKKAAA